MRYIVQKPYESRGNRLIADGQVIVVGIVSSVAAMKNLFWVIATVGVYDRRVNSYVSPE